MHVRRITHVLFGALVALLLVPAIASAIPRDVVVARGNVWVTGHVPYSQERYAYEGGSLVPTSVVNPSTKGYRTDCSGFISMCWNLRRADGTPLNLDTAGLDSTTIAVAVAKADLAPGDLMLRAKDKVTSGSGHAVLFVRWDDAQMVNYWAFEEASTKTGTVAHLRNYANDYGSGYFRPYRYKGTSPDYADVLYQVSGLDRYATAASAVELSFPTSTTVSVPAVVIASGESWPDALGGAALAGAYEGPLLLTTKLALPQSTRTAITRLKPAKVFVLGGAAAVSTEVVSQIASMGVPVTRIDGGNRYKVSGATARTAVTRARYRKRTVDTAYLSTGLNFPDALAASPLSARTRRPILLTARDSLTPVTRSTLRDLRVDNVVILGGTASISDEVERQLAQDGYSVSRIDGANRYSVAINIAHHGVGLGMGISWASLGLASGDSFADALSGGVAQGQTGNGSLLLLTPGDRLNDDVASELAEHRSGIGLLRVFGGSSSVEQPTRAAAATVLRALP